MPAILRNNLNYRRFLLSRLTILFGTMAVGFFAVYGVAQFATETETVATLTALFTGILIASQAVANLAWGIIGDRYGHKTVLAGAGLAMMAAALIAWLAPNQLMLSGAFIGLGIFLAAEQVSGLNIILEFCDEADRPTYIGLTNTLLAPFYALAPIIGGWLVTMVGYRSLFLLAGLIAGIGAGLMILWVPEPRQTAVT